MPAVADCTLTLMMQGVVVVRVEEGKVMVLPFAGAVTVPEQPLVVRPLGLEITKPEIKVSVSVTPVKLTVLGGAGLVTVMVNCDAVAVGTVVGLKDFVTVGGTSTAMVAVAVRRCRRH